MKLYSWVTTTVLACFQTIAFGQAGSSHVVYINGIQTTYAKAEATRSTISTLLNNSTNRSGAAKRSFNVEFVWNPEGWYQNATDTQGCGKPCQDIYELMVLKSSEEDFSASFERILAPHNASSVIDVAAAAEVRKYADSLVLGTNSALASGFINADRMSGTKAALDSLSGVMRQSARTIVVGHSQGNLIANLAWGTIAAEIGQELRKKVRVVNVANTARFSVNGLDLTHDDDPALAALKVSPGAYNFVRTTPDCAGAVCEFKLAGATFKAPSEFSCLSALLGNLNVLCKHYFVETYISSDDIPANLRDQGVTFTQNATKFKDRLEDLVYAAAQSLDVENAPKAPVEVFNNLGDRQFCTTTSTSVSCSGEPIGFIPGFGTIIPPQLQVKAAISFVAPASCPCDVTTFELPMYLSGGNNYFFVTFRRDAGGLPDLTAPGGIGGFSFPSSMPTVSSFAANPAFTTTTQNVDPTLVSIQPNARYWMEVSATDTTRAVWPFGRTGSTALVATTRSGNPYASLGDAAPAVRIVVTPR